MRLYLPPSDNRGPNASPSTLLTRVLDAHNPGVTMLVSIWVAGFALRTWLVQRELLTQLTNEALMSLLCVVPIMLVAWGVAAVADKRFNLGLFRSDDDQSS